MRAEGDEVGGSAVGVREAQADPLERHDLLRETTSEQSRQRQGKLTYACPKRRFGQ
jgi:hypothetical protein